MRKLEIIEKLGITSKISSHSVKKSPTALVSRYKLPFKRFDVIIQQLQKNNIYLSTWVFWSEYILTRNRCDFRILSGPNEKPIGSCGNSLEAVRILRSGCQQCENNWESCRNTDIPMFCHTPQLPIGISSSKDSGDIW